MFVVESNVLFGCDVNDVKTFAVNVVVGCVVVELSDIDVNV